jgi:uncharacterized protein (TIGR02145 family)
MKKILATLAVIGVLVISCKKDKDKAPPTAPLVKTAAITNNGGGNISTGGSIVSDNGAAVTKSGIAWSQGHATPTITDSIVEATATTGAFTININGIDFGKTYYFRAFATNSAGTGYGDVVTLTTSSDSVRFTYNGQSVTYGIIISPTTGKKWLDRNLGAKRVATGFDDYQAYGDVFQWGRPADGHQLINWINSTTGTPVNGTTTTLATSDVPGHSNFITPIWNYPTSVSQDWRSDNNSNRWVTTPQGPCPAGWHVPTKDEWMAETDGAGGTAGGIHNATSAFAKLKLTGVGTRNDQTGQMGSSTGNVGKYWSSSDHYSAYDARSDAFHAYFEALCGVVPGEVKAEGKAVRCIKD